MHYNILNLEPSNYSEEALTIISRLGKVDNGPLERDELIDVIGNYDILMARLGHRIDKRVLSAAPRLKIIVSATTGLNHIDVDEAERRGLKVLSLKGEREFLDTVYATAEHTWGLILAICRFLPQAHKDVINGNWDRDRFRGRDLNGSTLGIIGLGRIGTKVAGYGLAFGMNVLANDTSEVKVPPGVEMVDLETLLRESHVVSIHIDYSESTYRFFGKEELSLMRSGAFIVNTSRGEVLDEDALLKSLGSGHLGGAALDVLCCENVEGPIHSGLIEYARRNDNLIITPHIGGCTKESMEKTEIFMAQKLLKYCLKAED